MPQIQVNLGDVQAYDNLPLGEYLGEIEKIVYQEAKEAGRFPQLQVTYLVIDGDHVGRKMSQWVSMSPKAAFRLKRYFAKFGFGDAENLDVDDDTLELMNPDLVGVQVIFRVAPRRDDPERVDVDVISVETDMSQAPVAPPPPPPARRQAPPPPPVAAPARAARPAPVAPPPVTQDVEPEYEDEAVAEADAEGEVPIEEVMGEEATPRERPAPRVLRQPAAAPARPAPAPAPAGRPAPVRRTLR